jgi:mono/diheme cytochrome c family protein
MSRQLWIGTAVLGAALIVAPTLSYSQVPTEIGAREYFYNCAACHGTSGKGDGPLAGQLKTRVSDLTQIAKNNMGVFPFDRVYQVIDGRQPVAAHGPRDMPIWGDSFSSEAAGRMFGFATPKDLESFTRGQIIALIGYVYTLQAK